MKIALRILAGAGIIAITLWGVGALHLSPLLPEAWRPYGSSAYALLTVLALPAVIFRQSEIAEDGGGRWNIGGLE